MTQGEAASNKTTEEIKTIITSGKVEMPQTPHLELRSVRRELPSGGRSLTILEDVDLTITHGEFVAFLGPSGSGKSTLLALMAGLDRPSGGKILLDGKEIQDLSEDALARLRRREIGFVFQSFQLLPHLTAAENVLLPLELARQSDAIGRTASLLREVGLGDRGHHYPTQLSGGEQQRVALARAYACRPGLLLADEPTGNLDSATGETVLDLLQSLRQSYGTTLVLVTHDPVVAGAADRQVYLRDGRIERQEWLSKAAP